MRFGPSLGPPGALILLTGCASLLGTRDPEGAAAGAQAAPELPGIRTLRVRVIEDVTVVVEGDLGADVDRAVRNAVQGELSRRGAALVTDARAPADVVLRLDTHARGAVYFVESDLGANLEAGGVTIDQLRVETALYRSSDFAEGMARALVTSYLRSGPLANLAARRTPGPPVARARPSRSAAPRRDGPAVEEARRRTTEGTKYYNLGRYRDALAAYEAAYLSVADPALLFNIAQCHRKLGNRREAIAFYRSYLRNEPAAANRAEVTKRIGELEQQTGAKR